MANKKQLSLGELLDRIAVTGMTDAEIGRRLGQKDGTYLSKIRSAEKNGKEASKRLRKRIEDEFEFELTGTVSKKAPIESIIRELTERLIQTEAYVEVLTEELAHANMKLKVAAGQPSETRQELKYLTRRATEVAARRTSEYKS